MEIERKYLVEYPTIGEVFSMDNVEVKDIIQIYLKEEDGVEKRIRKICKDDGVECFYTEKRKISELEREEKEVQISLMEYLKMTLKADTSSKAIRKVRMCFTYESQPFELDFYYGAKSQAILEIELKDKEQEVILPDFIKLIKEVTFDPAYKNASLAKTLSSNNN